jgi:hypothetical protein
MKLIRMPPIFGDTAISESWKNPIDSAEFSKVHSEGSYINKERYGSAIWLTIENNIANEMSEDQDGRK